MQVHRDYACPNYIGRESLVIASSYSGNTEETLSGFAEARKRGAKLLVLTTGGKLADEAKAANLPLVTFSYKARPRATLGWSLGLVLGALSRIGLVRDLSSDITAALTELDRYAGTPDLGKDLARTLFGRIVGVYGAGVMGVMARRWKGQWNENAKNWSFFDVMPELNHNAVVGFPHPDIAPEPPQVEDEVLVAPLGHGHSGKHLVRHIALVAIHHADVRQRLVDVDLPNRRHVYLL